MITGAQNEFIQKVLAVVTDDAPKYGIKVVSPIIAQAIIESNWGKSGLAQKGKNLFGIKCGSSWKGASINMKTKEEYTPGTLTNISANFRKYDSFNESIHDYFRFINTKRYAKLKECTTPFQYCTEIKAAGYATSSSYVNTLMKCINTYNLSEYDKLLTSGKKDPEPVQPTTSAINYEKIVNDVINNVYGNGEDRIINLAMRGYDYLAIQYMVNITLTNRDLTKERDKLYTIFKKVKEALS